MRIDKILVLAAIGFAFVLTAFVTQAAALNSDKGRRTDILVGSELDFPPYALVTKSGHADGFSVDLMKAVCEVMGINVRFRVGPWDEVRAALEDGNVDALPLVSYSAEREKVFDFTTPHTVSYAAIFKRKDSPDIGSLDDLRGTSIITMRSDGTHDWLMRNNISKSYTLTNTMTDALRLLASGQHDYALVPRLVGLIAAKNLGLSNIEVTGPNLDVYGRGFGFAVKDGDVALLAQFNQGLAIIKENGRFDEIYDKWFGLVDPKGPSTETIVRNVAWGASGLLFLMALSLAWSFSLRRKVEARTQSLKTEIKERERVEKALAAHHHSLVRLQGLTSSTDLDFDEKAEALLKLGCETFNMPLGIISHITGEVYAVRYVTGPDWAPPQGTTFELANTYCIHTLNANAPTAFANAGQSEIATHPCYVNFGLESYIGCKVVVSGKMYGTLNFSNPEPHLAGFSEAEYSLVQLFADWLGSELTRKQNEDVIFQAMLAAEQANKAKSEFLSSMSHELRTPLNAILGFAQILSLDTQNPISDKHKDEAQQIIKGGEHLLDLINEVLNLAAIEAGGLELEIEPIDVEEVLETCLSMVFPLTHTQNVSVDTDHFAGVFVLADRVRFKQVLFNLLSNAVKYNKVYGNVSVTQCLADDGRQRISITDTGIGIATNKQADLFKPFARLGAENSNIEGSGIGLTITKHLLEAMKGDVGFESVEGQGSTFWLDLPLATPDEIKAAKRAAVMEKTDVSVADEAIGRVLYIEDNPANVDLMETILESVTGLEFESAPTAELGLAIALQIKPNLILMDINLPGMNGIEALAQLRLNEETKNIPVLAISAAAMPQDIQKALDAGFLAYLTKPFNVPELLEAISNVLEIKTL